MNSVKEEIKNKIKFLELAKELGNITKAARIMGYSITTYYNLKKIYELNGEEGLSQYVKRKPRLSMRLSKETEKEVLEIAMSFPKFSAARISSELKLKNIKISTGSVHAILKKNNLTTFNQRINKLNH